MDLPIATDAPDEEAAYKRATEAWWQDGYRRPDWSEQVSWYQSRARHEMDRWFEARTAFEWEQRPRGQRARLRITRPLSRIGKVVAYVIGAFLFAAACGIILSLFFGGGCIVPWVSC